MTDASGITVASRTVRVAAVQIEGRVGDLAHNLRQAEALATEALAHGAYVGGSILHACWECPCCTPVTAATSRVAACSRRDSTHPFVMYRNSWAERRSSMRRAGRR